MLIVLFRNFQFIKYDRSTNKVNNKNTRANLGPGVILVPVRSGYPGLSLVYVLIKIILKFPGKCKWSAFLIKKDPVTNAFVENF